MGSGCHLEFWTSLPPSPHQVNVMLVLATLLTFVHPFVVYWEYRREQKSPATA